MPFAAAAATDRGRLRPNNEDAILARPDLGLFAVADGMGGHAAGEIASGLAIATVERAVADATQVGEPPTRQILHAALQAANAAIHRRALEDRATRGMGTTLTCLWAPAPGTTAWIAHVGDSRAYRLRGGRLQQLTLDHTWVQEQVDAGALTRAQARVHPLSSVLSRAVGTDPALAIDQHRSRVTAGDLFLLCSDGLTGMLEDPDLADLLAQPCDPHDLVTQLVERANARGGVDNISAIVLRAELPPLTAATARPPRSATRTRRARRPPPRGEPPT